MCQYLQNYKLNLVLWTGVDVGTTQGYERLQNTSTTPHTIYMKHDTAHINYTVMVRVETGPVILKHFHVTRCYDHTQVAVGTYGEKYAIIRYTLAYKHIIVECVAYLQSQGTMLTPSAVTPAGRLATMYCSSSVRSLSMLAWQDPTHAATYI